LNSTATAPNMGTTMARLLPLLLFLLVGVVLMVTRQAPPGATRDARTFRPRGRARARSAVGDDGVVTLRRRDLAGLRDAYSAEPLDAARPLVRCSGCQSLYHAHSATVLARENGGRCAACGATGFAAVRILED
jgi:hypothetical protein